MATFEVALACESIDADACTNMLYFANRVLSEAISTSIILPFAASKLVRCWDADSFANCNLDTEPPFSARRDAMFSSACVKTATDIESKFIAFPDELAANEKMEDVDAMAPVPSCLPVEVAKLTDLRFKSFVSMVRAESSIDLLILTNDPLSPDALVKILTVTS